MEVRIVLFGLQSGRAGQKEMTKQNRQHLGSSSTFRVEDVLVAIKRGWEWVDMSHYNTMWMTEGVGLACF